MICQGSFEKVKVIFELASIVLISQSCQSTNPENPGSEKELSESLNTLNTLNTLKEEVSS